MNAAQIRLGLVGDNIRQSQSPAFHTLAGRQAGLDLTYELIVPAECGLSFEDVIARCRDEGYTGLNITYPYKERVLPLLASIDPAVARIGSSNTVLFRPDGPIGFNTDHSGFMTAFRHGFGELLPGASLVVGAGGVGRAVAFGLARLGASQILLADSDHRRAEAVAEALAEQMTVDVRIVDVAQGGRIADGVVNCTPIGMVGHEGSPVSDVCLMRKAWAFDVVYTPIDTVFADQAKRGGTPFVGGYELFFNQALDVFELFTSRKVTNPDRLRAELGGPSAVRHRTIA